MNILANGESGLAPRSTELARQTDIHTLTLSLSLSSSLLHSVNSLLLLVVKLKMTINNFSAGVHKDSGINQTVIDMFFFGEDGEEGGGILMAIVGLIRSHHDVTKRKSEIKMATSNRKFTLRLTWFHRHNARS